MTKAQRFMIVYEGDCIQDGKTWMEYCCMQPSRPRRRSTNCKFLPHQIILKLMS